MKMHNGFEKTSLSSSGAVQPTPREAEARLNSGLLP